MIALFSVSEDLKNDHIKMDVLAQKFSSKTVPFGQGKGWKRGEILMPEIPFPNDPL